MPATATCGFVDAGHFVRNEYACCFGATRACPSTCARRNRHASVFSGRHCAAGFWAFEWPMSPNAICTGYCGSAAWSFRHICSVWTAGNSGSVHPWIENTGTSRMRCAWTAAKYAVASYGDLERYDATIWSMFGLPS